MNQSVCHRPHSLIANKNICERQSQGQQQQKSDPFPGLDFILPRLLLGINSLLPAFNDFLSICLTMSLQCKKKNMFTFHIAIIYFMDFYFFVPLYHLWIFPESLYLAV